MHAVVWHARRVTPALGGARVMDSARRRVFGNAELSGDPGKGKRLGRAWIASSRQVPPDEQLAFPRRPIRPDGPVFAQAMTKAVVEVRRTCALARLAQIVLRGRHSRWAPEEIRPAAART
jgi:beta-lactamase class D